MATALEQNVLEAQPRESGNKNQARRVRREGKIPAAPGERGSAARVAHPELRHGS
jgi:ribosomal protein L25 (general stress protein Ctc)